MTTPKVSSARKPPAPGAPASSTWAKPAARQPTRVELIRQYAAKGMSAAQIAAKYPALKLPGAAIQKIIGTAPAAKPAAKPTAAQSPAQADAVPVAAPPVAPEASGPAAADAILASPAPDVSLALRALYKTYSLEGLSDKIVQMHQDGYSDDEINILLQDSTEWKDRFAGNEIRKKEGRAVIPPSQYLANEEGYRVALKELPGGMYTKADFDKWQGADVAPAEIGRRAQRGLDAARNIDPGYKAYLKTQVPGLDDSHIAAWALDQTRAEGVIQRQLDAGKLWASAYNVGLDPVSAEHATRLMDQGITENQAKQGYSQIAALLPDQKILGQRYGDTYTQQDAEDETFGGLASAARKRRSLNDQEGAQFAKSSGIQRETLGRATGGSY